MNARIWHKTAGWALTGVLALAVGAISLGAQSQDSSQQGDDVAAAARKAREQKKKEESKPKKVYTDDDVSSLRGGVSTPTATVPTMPGQEGKAEAKEGDGKDATGAEGKSKENPEAVWRKKFADAYKELNRAQKELDILQRENNKAQVQYYTDPQKALKEQYTRQEINDRDAKIAAKQKEVDQLKQKISDMEDDLRKSGGDPGWAAQP